MSLEKIMSDSNEMKVRQINPVVPFIGLAFGVFAAAGLTMSAIERYCIDKPYLVIPLLGAEVAVMGFTYRKYSNVHGDEN